MRLGVMYLLGCLLILKSTTEFLSVSFGIRMVMQELDYFRSYECQLENINDI